MNRYEYKGVMYTINELSDMSGIKPATLRHRLRSGYDVVNALKETPIHTSVEVFSEASYWMDWEGKSIEELYRIYTKWCDRNCYSTVPKQTFGKELQLLYPIYTVPSFYKGIYTRTIRFR